MVLQSEHALHPKWLLEGGREGWLDTLCYMSKATVEMFLDPFGVPLGVRRGVVETRKTAIRHKHEIKV